MNFRYCWEDFRPGNVYEHGPRALSQDEIVAFAREWDPQRFHVDPQAARDTPFGGLIASGWQTCSVAMRLMCDAYLNESSCIGSPGLTELKWLVPVRPGDSLRLRATVLDATPSRSKPDRGATTFRWEVLNQDERVVVSMTGVQFFLRRTPA